MGVFGTPTPYIAASIVSSLRDYVILKLHHHFRGMEFYLYINEYLVKLITID